MVRVIRNSRLASFAISLLCPGKALCRRRKSRTVRRLKRAWNAPRAEPMPCRESAGRYLYRLGKGYFLYAFTNWKGEHVKYQVRTPNGRMVAILPEDGTAFSQIRYLIVAGKKAA